MEKKISISTITTCVAILELKLEKMQKSIDSYDEPSNVPAWMYEAVCEYNSAIDELKEYIGL